ncbi:hypothetical protein [Herbidospora mongoliensis]|uniref:hypothetical protein n=1 Tax=Herbidospora mongoliensis TaxID=688067 RepID=UPI00082E47C6|nr:hypothetical protein [Herbidospora mongoliensis]
MADPGSDPAGPRGRRSGGPSTGPGGTEPLAAQAPDDRATGPITAPVRFAREPAADPAAVAPGTAQLTYRWPDGEGEAVTGETPATETPEPGTPRPGRRRRTKQASTLARSRRMAVISGVAVVAAVCLTVAGIRLTSGGTELVVVPTPSEVSAPPPSPTPQKASPSPTPKVSESAQATSRPHPQPVVTKPKPSPKPKPTTPTPEPPPVEVDLDTGPTQPGLGFDPGR